MVGEEKAALYVRDGDGFVGTSRSGSAWDRATQSGGAVLALLGHVLEVVPTLVPMSLTRLTVDIVRPVPVGEHLQVVTEILREGRKIQLVDPVISAGDPVTTRARALHTYYAHDVAHGMSMAVMSDAEGVFGVTSTSQVLDSLGGAT